LNITDRWDLVSLATNARWINQGEVFSGMNENIYGSAVAFDTHFDTDGVVDMYGNRITGNHHSWYLYLSRPEVQHELRLFDVPTRAPW
jgi:hypothetical protein